MIKVIFLSIAILFLSLDTIAQYKSRPVSFSMIRRASTVIPVSKIVHSKIVSLAMKEYTSKYKKLDSTSNCIVLMFYDPIIKSDTAYILKLRYGSNTDLLHTDSSGLIMRKKINNKIVIIKNYSPYNITVSKTKPLINYIRKDKSLYQEYSELWKEQNVPEKDIRMIIEDVVHFSGPTLTLYFDKQYNLIGRESFEGLEPF